MKLSAIVPAYNEEKLISSTLASIRNALIRGFGADFELIVVDNASEDRTAELASRAGARIVYEPVHHIARVRNTGAANATGDWFLFIDADCWPEADLIEEVVRSIENGRVAGGGSILKMEGISYTFSLVVAFWNWLSRVCQWAAGSFIFCRADAFREIGGFNLEFYAAEEIDFSRRLKLWGQRKGLSFALLHRYPVLTSARKIQTYTRGELFKVFLQALRHPRRFVRERHFCTFWYDGRR